MKSVLKLVGIFTFLFILSCEKEGKLNYSEKRIVGEWYYSKVKITEKGRLKTETITDSYAGRTIEFLPNFDMEFKDEINNISYSGVWDLISSTSDDECINTIFASYTNDENGEIVQLVFENISVTYKKLTARFSTKNERYNYVLLKK